MNENIYKRKEKFTMFLLVLMEYYTYLAILKDFISYSIWLTRFEKERALRKERIQMDYEEEQEQKELLYDTWAPGGADVRYTFTFIEEVISEYSEEYIPIPSLTPSVILGKLGNHLKSRLQPIRYRTGSKSMSSVSPPTPREKEQMAQTGFSCFYGLAIFAWIGFCLCNINSDTKDNNPLKK